MWKAFDINNKKESCFHVSEPPKILQICVEIDNSIFSFKHLTVNTNDPHPPSQPSNCILYLYIFHCTQNMLFYFLSNEIFAWKDSGTLFKTMWHSADNTDSNDIVKANIVEVTWLYLYSITSALSFFVDLLICWPIQKSLPNCTHD